MLFILKKLIGKPKGILITHFVSVNYTVISMRALKTNKDIEKEEIEKISCFTFLMFHIGKTSVIYSKLKHLSIFYLILICTGGLLTMIGTLFEPMSPLVFPSLKLEMLDIMNSIQKYFKQNKYYFIQ